MSFHYIRHHPALTFLGATFIILVFFIIGIVLFSEPIIRSLTENKGGEKLGRTLTIEGDLKIDWHWTYTYVHAENIRLSNAPDYPEANMLTIDALDFTFKPLKLLLGKLEFGKITLNKPYLILERKSADNMNWNFPTLSKENAVSEATLADNRHDFPIFAEFELNAGHLIYRDAVKGMNLDLKLTSVNGLGGDDNAEKNTEQQFKISGAGSLQNEKFVLEASGGSLESLRDSTKPFPLKLTLVMGSTKIFVEGRFTDPIKLTGVNANLTINGHNMADLFYLTAIPLPPTPPYMLEGTLTKQGNIWAYEHFNGKVGDSDLTGDLSYDISNTRGLLTANLSSQVMNSADLGGFIGLSPSGKSAAPEQKLAAAEKKASPKLIPDVPLQLERLRATDLDVTLKAAKINAPGLPFKGMEVRFNLKNGRLALDPLRVVLADGTIDGDIVIDASKDVPPMEMNLNLHKLNLGQFFDKTRFAKTTQGFFGGKVHLAGTGSSLADVLASSNGEITIIMSGGKISLLLIEASDLDIAQALPLFFGKDKSTQIRCGVLDFDVKNGILASKVVVLDTNDSLLTGNVGIDMKREVINAKLDAKPKDSSFFSAQIPIVVSGKLKQPAIGLDARQLGKRGTAAALLGTLLTPFAAILPFIETGEDHNTDCRALIYNARN